MRFTSRALIGGIIIACTALQLRAAETGSRWWPFGQREEAKVAQPPSVAPPSQAPLQTQRQYGALNPAQPPTTATVPRSQVPPAAGTAADGAAKESWMLSSPKRKISWPHLTRPERPKTGLLAQKTEPDATRNSWVDKTPPEPKASPLKPIKESAQKVATRTKSAWHKTVDAFTPGEPAPEPRPNSSRIAQNDAQPRFWQRLLGQEEQAKQPQTVPEWMAQERVDRR